MTEDRKELFSEKVPAGRRTYFFDVKESVDGDKYLVISESRYAGGESHERHRVMVFEEHLVAFTQALTEAAGIVMGEGTSHSYIEYVRRQHPRAYEKWDEQEDVRLAREYEQSRSRAINTLAKALGRQPGAIRSRLRKLGLP